jgi:hypothetical protein
VDGVPSASSPSRSTTRALPDLACPVIRSGGLRRTRAGLGHPRNAICESCAKWLGLYGGEVRPRLARGIGACAPEVLSGVLLCGSAQAGCCGRVDARDPEMEARGFWIPPGSGPEHDPQQVPVVLAGQGVRKIMVWLSPAGTYSFEDPARRALAGIATFPPYMDCSL